MFKFTSSLALTSLVAAQNLLPETEDITRRELHFSADLSLLTYYKSQAECDALHHDSRYHYEWNSDACRCFHVFDQAYSFTCAAGEFYNPLHEAFDTTDLCINMSAYDLIFTNSLGPDCIDGTGDDPSVPQTSNPNPTPPEPFAGFNNAACATAGYTNGGSIASAEIHAGFPPT